MLNLAKHRTSFFFLIMLFLFCGTGFAIMYAKGYKFDFGKKQIVPNGILVADSNPVGALVYVDNKLKTATNNTVSLPPKEYKIEIKKEGFHSWQKNLLIEKELVAFAEAFLFPMVADIKPLTFSGAVNPKISPDSTRIVYLVPKPNTDVGLWVMDITDTFSFFGKTPRLITENSLNFDLEKANYDWSPDSRQIVLEFGPTAKYLLDPNIMNNLSQLQNIANQFNGITTGWQAEEKIKFQAKMKKAPEKMQEILENRAGQIIFSPDANKIMYIATASAEIPTELIPPILSASTQKETRKINPSKLYIYDIKEDKNFEITNFPAKNTPAPSKSLNPYIPKSLPQWFPTSRHLIWIEGDKIVACEYDNTNLTTVYSGSFIKPFVFITPNTNRLIILADIDFTIEKPTATPTPAKNVKKIKITPAPIKPKTNLFSVSFR